MDSLVLLMPIAQRVSGGFLTVLPLRRVILGPRRAKEARSGVRLGKTEDIIYSFCLCLSDGVLLTASARVPDRTPVAYFMQVERKMGTFMYE